MPSPMLRSRMQSAVPEYSIFFQFWPRFAGSNGERRMVGTEIELVGSHSSNPNHFDPGCPMCRHVRYALLTIANEIVEHTGLTSRGFMVDIDSHANLILILPALGSRSLATISLNISWNNGNDLEPEVLSDIKRFLSENGIHQR